MKRILFAILCVLGSGWAGAGQPLNAWSTQDYDFYAGDFNGDGYTDILYVGRNPSLPSGILLSDGTAPTIAGQTWASDYLGIPWSSNVYTVLVGDFNGDGKTDIFLQSNTPGDSYLLLTDSSGKVTAISQTIPAQAMGIAWSADQHHLVVGDFNEDGHADLFFQPTVSGGTSAVVHADSNGQFTSSAPAQVWNDGYLGFNWAVSDASVYSGDFNGDGRSDLLIQAWPNSSTGDGTTAYGYPANMNGVVLAQPGTRPFLMVGVQSWSRNAFGVDWSPVNYNLIIADFNGDGRADVLLQPQTAGGASHLLFGNARGPIFKTSGGPLTSDIALSADAAVLLAGKFAGGSTAGLLIQATSREGSNSIAKNIVSGVHPRALAFPVLTAASVSRAGTGYPAGDASSAGTTVQLAVSAATVAPTSAGRTAGQFSVTPTGAASYNIPLWTPPGARGIEPQLALHYTSGGPDGPMGPGWSLTGTSAIVRCGKTWASSGGAPASVTLSTTDDICLNGNRLRLTAGTQGVAGSTYQTEIADFSNVSAYGAQGNGPQYFIVQGKDGRYYEYGNTTDSRIFGSAATTPYAWALNKVRDRQGNNMVFTYSSGATALTLAKIQYTATPGTSFAAPYEVDFNYVTRTGGTTITKHVAGGTVSQTKQIDNINVLASGASVRKYQLGYAASPTTNRPLLQTVQECGGSAGTDCLRATTISYQSGGAGWSTTATSTGLTGQYGFVPVDINGDGIPDVVYGKPAGSSVHWYARIATVSGYGAEIDTGATTSGQGPLFGLFDGTGRTGFLAPVSGIWYLYSYKVTAGAFTNASTSVSVNGEIEAVDYDGDGLADLVSTSGTNVLVRRNITLPGGHITFASSATTVATGVTAGSNLVGTLWNPLYTADFNGDGRADLLLTYTTTGFGGIRTTYVTTILSNGFAAAATVTQFSSYGSALALPLTGDWNGDGCTDIITPGAAYLSNCNGTYTAVNIGSTAGVYKVVDWDGDGQTDLLTVNASNHWQVYRSTGNGAAAPIDTGVPYNANTTGPYFFFDRNSDGQAELAVIDSTSSYAVSYYLHKGVNTPPDLAISITDGFGINFSPTYTPISQYNYTKNSDAVFPDIDFQGPMYVVNQFSASDGTGPIGGPGGTYTNDFWYYGAHLNMRGRGFEGFYAARQHDSRNGVYQFSYYRRDFPYIGSLYEQDTVESDQLTYVARTVNSYTYTNLAGTNCSLRCFPYVNSSTVYNYEPAGSKKGASGAYISYTTTNYTYDSYGSLTDTKATTTDTDSAAPASPFNGQSWITEITNTITNDTSANWCLGRPSTTTTTKTVPGQPAQTRTVSHTIDYAACRATVETVEPTDTRLKVTTNFGFDACGNTNSVSVVGLDQNGVAMPARTTTTSYATRCQLPESVTNPLNQPTQTAYRYDLGVPSSTTDPNGITVSWLYDDFGRKTKETRPDGTYTTYSYTDCVSSSCWGVPDLRFLVVGTAYSSAGTQLRADDKFYDGLDRLRYDEGNRVTGTWTTTYSTYDSLGRKIATLLPYSSGAYGNGHHQYSYDVANRATQDALYNNAGALYRTITMGYAGQTVTVTDPNGNPITKVTDVAGKIRRVTDPSTNGTVAGTTNYIFDPFGNLITIVDADNYQSSYSYNIRGFKTASADADTGSWTFTPDSLNELVSQTDSNKQVISFGYDLVGRMTSRTEPESTTATRWTYGTSASAHEIGRLKSVSKPDGYGEAYVYDGVGRPQTVTYAEDGVNYAFDYVYNNMGTVDTLTYPVSTSGVRFALKSVYDAYGYLNQVKDNSAGTVFWTLNSANDASFPTLETLGNGVQVATSYMPWTNEMITRTEGSGGSTTNLQNLTYNWDLAGNLHQRIDNRQSLTEQFAYDSMNRLLTSTLNGGNNLTLTYDASGNINSKSDVSASVYVYDTVHKHAVKTAGSWSMTYDANGNMITRAGGSISWYSYNLPNTVNYSGNSTQFFYNAGHQRWKQIANYGGTVETTHYIGGMLEVMTRGSGPTEYRHQIPASSGSAVYTRRTDGSTGTYYATSDHLGSSDLVADSAANVLTRESFTPFGARRGSSWAGVPSAADYTAFGNTTRKGFTGHEMLDSVNLVHMNGRVYDPYLGRFISADTVIQSLAATQSINPYAYAWNDPLKYVDPSGHSLLGAILGIVAAIVTCGAIAAIELAVYGATLTAVSMGFIAGFVGGFVGALVATGSLSAALTAGLISGVTAALTAGIGQQILGSNWTRAEGVIARSAVGCASTAASGGNCGEGALAAAFTPTQTNMNEQQVSLGMSDPKAVLELAAHHVEEYLVRQEIARIAEKNGLSLTELDAILLVASVTGEQIGRGRLEPHTDQGVQINGVLTRGWYAAPFDVVDIALAYQGLPTGAFLRYAIFYTDEPIVAHSLGTLDASNLLGLGLAHDAQLYAVPLGMIVPSGFGNVTIANSSGDAVTGFFLGNLFNPDATNTGGALFAHAQCNVSASGAGYWHQFCPQ